jgi:hypothetical protein
LTSSLWDNIAMRRELRLSEKAAVVVGALALGVTFACGATEGNAANVADLPTPSPLPTPIVVPHDVAPLYLGIIRNGNSTELPTGK